MDNETTKPLFTNFEIFMMLFISVMIMLWIIANVKNSRRARKEKRMFIERRDNKKGYTTDNMKIVKK